MAHICPACLERCECGADVADDESDFDTEFCIHYRQCQMKQMGQIGSEDEDEDVY
jgi:hypothetical protein